MSPLATVPPRRGVRRLESIVAGAFTEHRIPFSNGMLIVPAPLNMHKPGRAASGCDPETGDGAGILIQIPDAFLRRECAALDITLPAPDDYGVGMVFLPRDPDARRQCETIIENVTRREGQRFLGWRDVPTD